MSVNSDYTSYDTIDSTSLELLDHLSTGEFIPGKFYGINCALFGSTLKNPFFKIKEIALDPKIPIDDRMRAIRYMNRIPHSESLNSVIEASKTIIDDESCPIGERYFFISNNDKFVKLSDQAVKECHVYFYKISTDKHPLILRLLSAQFIYTSFSHNDDLWKDAREFIVKLAVDKQETIRIRAEACDILCKRIRRDDAIIGTNIIYELGNLYIKNKMTSIYTNTQNAHNESITESVMSIIRTLITAKMVLATQYQKENRDIDTFTGKALHIKTEQNSGDIFEKILELSVNLDEERKNKIISVFNFILIYPAKYEGINLIDVLCLVWNKICDQPIEIKKELEQRLLQELYDMDNTCGSGMVTRIINILSGYIQEEGLQIKMNIKDQVRANIFGRLQANMRMLPQKNQEDILEEISNDNSDKETAKEFIESYSVYDELVKEFVELDLIDKDEFRILHDKCIDDFMGI
jgi:hypothetical protein